MIFDQIYMLNAIACSVIVGFLWIKSMLMQNNAEYFRHFQKCLMFAFFVNLMEVACGYAMIADLRNTDVNYVIAALYDIFTLWLCYWCYRFSRRMVKINVPAMKKHVRFLNKLPVYFIMALIIMSYKNNIIIELTDLQKAVHGKYYFLFSITAYGYIVYAIISALINSRSKKTSGSKTKEANYKKVIKVGLPCVALCLIQLRYGGIPYATIGITMAMLLFYEDMTDRGITFDALSKVKNKATMMELIEQKIKNNDSFFLVLLDIDRFKHINDTFGHITGDKVISEVGGILLELSETFGAEAARFGGDEFCVIWDFEPSPLIKEIKERVSGIKLDDNDYVITISAGFCKRDKTITDSSSLISVADEKMYAEKNSNRQA